MNYSIKINQLQLIDNKLTLAISGMIEDPEISDTHLPRPKLVLYFDNGSENRRLPLVLNEISYINGKCCFEGEYTYRLDLIYWSTRGMALPSLMTLKLSYGRFYEEKAEFELKKNSFEALSESFSVEPAENSLNITPLPVKKKSGPVRLIQRVGGVIFYFLTFLLALCLIPWFLLEALLSFAGITKLHPKVKTNVIPRKIIGHVNARFSQLTTFKITLQKSYKGFIILLYTLLKPLPIKQNRITFISMRRNELSGNFAFVYDKLKHRDDLDIKFILSYSSSAVLPLSVVIKFCFSCAVSRVIVLDEFTPQIHYLTLKKQTKLIQLWHACGAFKTFGFTRLGKPSGSPQTTKMHRSYDYVTVSSGYCKKCHSEGFGISDEKIVPTGIARTDVFFDDSYKSDIKRKFFEKYPTLQGKKIILFAPTFRGDVKETAYYPTERFDIEAVCKELGDDYAIIVKHHPFVTEKQPIPQKYSSTVIDLSEQEELNDLLFVTDIIITDYSSLVFEAALLKIPMLFYVFDLKEYIKSRDFYFDLQLDSPGKLVYTLPELINAIKAEDFEAWRIEAFAHKFFDSFDGKSSERIAELIIKALHE